MSDQFRAARRAFIRENHPDRGGDPAAFAQGLQVLNEHLLTEHLLTERLLTEHRNGPVPVTDPPPVIAYRSRRTAPARWVRRLRRSARQGRNLQ